MKIPSRKECMDILKRENVPENIVKHSIEVSRIATKLARALERRGETVNVALVERAALLHDVSKFKCLGKVVHHKDMGSKLLREMGYKEIADIVENHCLDSITGPGLRTWEEKLVYYADKRVNGSEQVSLNERKEYLRRKYPEYRQRIEKVWPLVEKLENEINEKSGKAFDAK